MTSLPSNLPHRCAALALVSLFSLGSAAFAADTAPAASPAAAAAAEKLAPARKLIAESKWVDAIAALRQVNDSGSADWNNLMGYSHRKAKVPDYAKAEQYYNEALRIEPQHRGALEYSGQLYLNLNDLPRAEARLAALDKACTFGCEEYTDLKNAIAAYKANGNKLPTKP